MKRRQGTHSVLIFKGVICLVFALLAFWLARDGNRYPVSSSTFYVTIGLLACWLGSVSLVAGGSLRNLVREVERLEQSLEEAATDAHRRITAIAHRVDRLEGEPSPEMPELPDAPEWGMTAVPPSDRPR